MPLCRSLLVLALFVSAGRAAELRTLKGDVYSGQLVSVSTTEVVFLKGAEQIKVPTEQVLNVGDLGPVERVPADTAYLDVELRDGSIFHCSACRIVGKKVEMTLLLTGQKVEVPLDSVSNLLNKANVEKYRKDWTERLRKKVKDDMVMLLLESGQVNGLEGKLGDGTDDGTRISFIVAGKDPINVLLENVHGLIFKRDPATFKPPICKITDGFRDVVMVETIAMAADAKLVTVTTPSGAKLQYPLAKLSLLDYSNGKLVWLSDMNPSRVVEWSTEDRIDHYKRDRNMDGKDKIKMGAVIFEKGLALHAYTLLDYDLNGDYSVFKFVPGLDVVGGHGKVKLRIEADGKEIYSETFDRKSWRASNEPKPISLNIKDVTTLRIEVLADDPIGLCLGKHVVMADAKVSK